MFYLYKIENQINWKKYFGKTNDIDARFNYHRRANGDIPALHGAIKKYGANNFAFSIIGEYESEQDAFEAEKYHIAYFKTNICRYGNEFGYNLTDGGEGHTGHIPSEETRRKISQANKGKVRSEEVKKHLSEILSNGKHPMYGKKLLLSEEQREAKSARMSGENNPMYGKTPLVETIAKLCLVQRGENNGNAKLTWNDVNEIRAKFETGNYTRAELMNEYNMSRTSITDIVRYKIWKVK